MQRFAFVRVTFTECIHAACFSLQNISNDCTSKMYHLVTPQTRAANRILCKILCFETLLLGNLDPSKTAVATLRGAASRCGSTLGTSYLRRRYMYEGIDYPERNSEKNHQSVSKLSYLSLEPILNAWHHAHVHLFTVSLEATPPTA